MNGFNDVITWLRGVELLAGSLYEKTGNHFAEDAEFSAFLHRLAADETWHYHLIGSARALLEDVENHPSSVIAVDEQTKLRVEAPFQLILAHLESGTLTKREMVNVIVDTEFSEWNDIFIYVVQTCQGCSKAFQRIAAAIQAHQKRIESYINSLPADLRPARQIGKLPPVWEPQYLIVEDDPAIRELFSRILSHDARIVTAADGAEGLQKITAEFFDLILSDVDMPNMDGLELCSRAKESDPNIVRRFIFCSGVVTTQLRACAEENGIEVLEKPVQVSQLRQVARAVAARNLHVHNEAESFGV
jgi:CheY-like chemotaxis protein